MAWYEKTTDDFNRVENPLSTGWTTMTGVNGMKANGAQALVSVDAAQNASFRTSVSLANNQYAQGKYNNAGWIGVGCRGSENNIYHCNVESSINTGYFFKFVGGTQTQLGAKWIGVSSTSIIRTELVGTTMEIFVNNVSKGTRDDSSLSTGSAGIYGYNGQAYNDSLDNFSAGDDQAPAGGIPVLLSQYRRRWAA